MGRVDRLADRGGRVPDHDPVLGHCRGQQLRPRHAHRRQSCPAHDRRPLARLPRRTIHAARVGGGVRRRPDRRQRQTAAGSGTRMPARWDAARDRVCRSRRLRRRYREAATAHAHSRRTPESFATAGIPWQSGSRPRRGTALPLGAAAVPRRSARRRAAARNHFRSTAGNPPPFPSRPRRVPAVAHRRVVAAALRARPPFHPADTAARPGAGSAGGALAGGVAVIHRAARGAGGDARLPGAGAARSAGLRQEHVAAPARTRPRARRAARRRRQPRCAQHVRPLEPPSTAAGRPASAATARVAGAGMGTAPPATATVRRSAGQRPARPAARRGQRTAARRRRRLPPASGAVARFPRRTAGRHARDLLLP